MINPVVMTDRDTFKFANKISAYGDEKVISLTLHLTDEPLFMVLSVDKYRLEFSVYLRYTAPLDDKSVYSEPDAKYVYNRMARTGEVLKNTTDEDIEEMFWRAFKISTFFAKLPSETYEGIDFSNEWIQLTPHACKWFNTYTYYGMSREPLACIAPDGGIVMPRPYPDEIAALKRFSAMSEDELRSEALSGDEYAIHMMINNSRSDPQQYIFWLEQLAAKDDEDAMLELGLCYLEGITGELDLEKAFEWLTRSGENGNMEAEKIAGTTSTIINIYPVEYDPEYWNGLGESYYHLGILINRHMGHCDGDISKEAAPCFNKAIECIRKAVEMDYPDACLFLATIYGKGNGVERSIEKRVELLEKGAALGGEHCLFELGKMYLAGNGVPQSFDKGIELIERSGESTYSTPMRFLGRIYERGYFVERNIDKALYWYKKYRTVFNDSRDYYIDEKMEDLERAKNDKEFAEYYFNHLQLHIKEKLFYNLDEVYTRETESQDDDD